MIPAIPNPHHLNTYSKSSPNMGAFVLINRGNRPYQPDLVIQERSPKFSHYVTVELPRRHFRLNFCLTAILPVIPVY